LAGRAQKLPEMKKEAASAASNGKWCHYVKDDYAPV